MLRLSQGLLWATTALIIVAFIVYLMAVITAHATDRSAARARVLADSPGTGTDGGSQTGRASAKPATPGAAVGPVWVGAQLTQMALLLLTAALILRTIVTGHAPFANHYEFALSFAWGMILAQVFFEWRYRVRTLALISLPLILGMLIYAATLSYAAEPLIPALQNSPLLTLHVITAAIGYGAGMVACGSAIMYLLAPHVKWRGWPRQDTLDELGYKAVVVTFPLLTMMLILGSLWANIAWGSYWSWDPKETAALVTWIIYGAYLHARVTRGWRGNRAAWLLVIAFGAILFTYFGNLFFGGLHAYA